MKALAGMKVSVNTGYDWSESHWFDLYFIKFMPCRAEKPRKGVFAVTVGGTEVFSTGPEARPFPKLKAIDIDEVAKLVRAAC